MRDWVAKFICGTNRIFHSYPMNNVWELGLRVGKEGENIGKHGLWWGQWRNFGNRALGGGNGGNAL